MSYGNQQAQTQSQSGGIGFCGLLTILFIGLKLAGVIAWSWVWVLSPFWIGALATICILALIVLVAILLSFFD